MKRSSCTKTASLFSALLLGISATAVLAADDESYQLASKDDVRPVGTVVTSDVSKTLKDAPTIIETRGRKIEGQTSTSLARQEISEVISATKIRYTIARSEVGQTITVNGQAKDHPQEPEALLKIPYILELKDGKWVASLEDGGEPTAKQSKELKKKEESANRHSDLEMYGSTPRKVGDEWKADLSKLGIAASADSQGSYTVKFLEVKEIDGVKCAVLKGTYDFKDKLETGSVLRMTGEAVSIRSIADMIDLEVRMTSTETWDISLAQGASVHFAGPSEWIQKTTLKKP